MKDNENEKLYKNFCNNISKILKKMEMKKIDFARLIGIGYKNFCLKMKGNGKFNLAQQIKIANELGEYIEDLVKEDYVSGD